MHTAVLPRLSIVGRCFRTTDPFQIARNISPIISARGYANASTVDDLVAVGQRHVTKGIGRLTEAIMTKGEGSYVNFHDGRRLLDFTCGIGVTNLGHCHPKVSQAAAEQCMNLVHCQCSISFHGPSIRLIEKLLPAMPDPSLDSFYFWNSGSEAVEAAIKMARVITGRQNIICMQGAYHGRTYAAMAVTKSKTVYSEGFFPLMARSVLLRLRVELMTFGMSPDTSEGELVRLALYQLDLVLKQQTVPHDTAAIIIEPVLGEGGYVPAPSTFLRGLRDVCDKHGILLIVDEVQSGFGRTGKMFNIEHSGGLANGFPLSCIVSCKELTDRLKPGSMGGTYAGNAVSCAAAVAVMDAFAEEKVLDNVNARSKELFASLKSIQNCPEIGPNIVDVRGQGLMVAVEFASPSFSPQDPAMNPSTPKGLAARVAKRCLEKGMLILTTSVYEVIRFIPPLNVSQEDLKKGLFLWPLISLVLSLVQAYTPAQPTNSTLQDLGGTSTSRLTLQWYSNGSDTEFVYYLLAGSSTNGISQVRSLSSSTILMMDEVFVRIQYSCDVRYKQACCLLPTATTPWIAFISCDANSTNASQELDIFTLARDSGALAALLYSVRSESCAINPAYTDPDNDFDHVFDIFATQSFRVSNFIEYEFAQFGQNGSYYGTYNATMLNATASVVNESIALGNPVAPGPLFATLQAFNATASPNNGSSVSGSAASAANDGSSCVSALFCLVIISGAIRAIRHPERYGPRMPDHGGTGDPVVKFGSGEQVLPVSRPKDVEVPHVQTTAPPVTPQPNSLELDDVAGGNYTNFPPPERDGPHAAATK
ncbi:hypothetical protein ID866_5754 [Astraeus odoratus]|nr:hypothetical protein ID866_5754 [Astraeus odoratus]